MSRRLATLESWLFAFGIVTTAGAALMFALSRLLGAP